MATDGPLPPHLEQFVREQVAAGRFRTEGEVIRTALGLLEERSHARDALHVWLKRELDRGLGSRPAEPVTAAFWDRHRTRVHAASAAAGHDS